MCACARTDIAFPPSPALLSSLARSHAAPESPVAAKAAGSKSSIKHLDSLDTQRAKAEAEGRIHDVHVHEPTRSGGSSRGSSPKDKRSPKVAHAVSEGQVAASPTAKKEKKKKKKRSTRTARRRKKRITLKDPVDVVKVLYEFAATEESELSIKVGQVLTIYEQDGSGWWYAKNEAGEQGFIPGNYVKSTKGAAGATTEGF